MDRLSDFSELELDLLKELFNVGVGYAAASLSKLVQQPVALSVPNIHFFYADDLIEYFGENPKLCLVNQTAEGDFTFRSTLLFPEHSSLELVRQFIPASVPDALMVEMREEAISEIGNVLLNACVGRMGDMADTRFDLGLPECRLTDSGQALKTALFGSEGADYYILLVSIEMILKQSEFSGEVMFIFDPPSLSGFRQHISAILDKLKK